MFISKQVGETLVMKKDVYSYHAECIFVKNGKKQIWRYSSYYDGKDKIFKENINRYYEVLKYTLLQRQNAQVIRNGNK